MKVTIVIRTYNRPQYLKEALTSVSLQTYTNWELIIFDDGGDVETFEIFTTFNKSHPDNRVIYISSQRSYDMFKNSWVLAPKIATGDVIIRLDDDDILRRTTFEKIINIYDTSPELDFTLGSCANFNKNGITNIEYLKNIYEIEPSRHAWAPYTILNNNPWKDPWMWYENYYQYPMYFTSLIHSSKSNIKMVYHLYTMRTKSVLKVIDDISMTSTHVDDLEFYGILDYKGLGYNVLKNVLIFVRADNLDKITYSKSENGMMVDEVLRVRDDVDKYRPEGFMSRIINISPELRMENISRDELNSEFSEYYTLIKITSDNMFRKIK